MSEELKKSEILFLYESSYNIPNGDPFTGEQRFDEETKKILTFSTFNILPLKGSTA